MSGQLVGGREYFVGVGEEMKSGTENLTEETSKFWDRLFSDMADTVYGTESGKGGENEESEDLGIADPPRYVHLRDARIFHPGGSPLPTNRGVWWRTRLEAVDGFSFGRLGTDADEDDEE